MKYITQIIGLILIPLFMIFGCGKESTFVDLPANKLSILLEESNLNKSSNRLKLDLLLKNDYDKEILVSLKSLNISIDSCSIKKITLTPKTIDFSKKRKEVNLYADIQLNKDCNPHSFYLEGDTNLALKDGSNNSVNYKSSEISIKFSIDTNNSTETNDINNSTVDEHIYDFYNIPKEIKISKPNFEYSFKVQVIDSKEKIVSGQNISILAYDVKYGEIKNMSSITDSNGFSTFIFTSAASLKGLDDKVLTLKLALEYAGVKKYTNIKLKFQELSTPNSKDDYYLINPTKLTVKIPSIEQKIFVDLVDSQGVGVPSKEIKITTPNSIYGSILSSSVKTNTSGRAIFVYKSPTDIISLDGKKIDLKLTFIEDNTFITKVVTITFLKKSTINYHLMNVESIIVDLPSISKNITVDLVDNQNNPISGKSIKISALDRRFGVITNSIAKTDNSGRAIFSYIAIDNLTAINGKSTDIDLTFTEDGVTIRKTVTIKIVKKVAPFYRMINVVDLSVEFPSKEYTINAYLVDERGVAVSGKKIEITTLNSRFGILDSSIQETALSTGKVSFTYTSPKDIHLIDGESTKITFIFMEDDVEIRKTVKLSFVAVVEDLTLPIVVIPNNLEEILLSNNSQIVEIPIKVFKDNIPYSEGFVKVQLPEKVLNGVDVGSFSNFSTPVNEDGVAILTYRGPSNLKSLIDNGDINSTFKIYHSENTSTDNRKSLLVKYNISADDYIPINYNLNVITENSDFSMGIPDIEKNFSILLKDSEGNIINDKDINITFIEVQTENSLVVQLFDSNNSILVDRISLDKKNNTPFILKSKTLSGLAPIKVTMSFTDINDRKQLLSTVINVRVLSGLPSALSISYLNTSQDTERAKYKEKFIVSVTDEYSNKVNTKPYISLGAIVGYAVDGKESSSRESNITRRLFYGKKDIDTKIADGVIDDLGDDNVHTTTFLDNTVARSDVFKYVNSEGVNSDKLLVFGRGKGYEAMGKWDFNKIDNSTLNLEDNYFAQTKGELYYTIGHNYYQDQCLDDGREWLGTTDSETYQLDDEGSVVVSYKYDYQLMGKDASIWVNLNGYQPNIDKQVRIGEVIKHTLRGIGLRPIPSNGYSLEKGTSIIAPFEIWQESTTEPYRNAHFGWSIKDGSTCEITSIESSNHYDARTCNNGYSTEGRAYITFRLKAGEDKGCTFNITRTLISSEF
jgi:hypothetical protein